MHGAAGCERVEHDAARDGDQRSVEDRARAEEPVDIRLAFLAPLAVLVGVIGDQPRRAVDLGHHRIAGVDAEAALDAAELRALADVDAGRADVDALHAVDAVAGGLVMRMRRRRMP